MKNKSIAILTALGIGCILAVSARAQTMTIPAAPTNFVWSSTPSVDLAIKTFQAALVLNSTNWNVVTYGLDAPGTQGRWGGGIGAYYRASTYTITGLRLDWVDGGFYMPSFNAGLQYPITLGKVATLTPFGIAAIGVPLSGAKILDFTVPGHITDKSGQATAILGYGIALDFTSAPKWVPGLIVDRETWSGFPAVQTRFGFNWKF